MRKLSIGATTILLAGTTPLLAQSELEAMVDGILMMAEMQGSAVVYSDKIVGSDGSVELRGLSISDDRGELVLATDWFQVTPGDIDGRLVFTMAPMSSMTVDVPDFGSPYVISLMHSGLVISIDDLLPGMADDATREYSVVADSLQIMGEGADNPFLRMLNLSATELNVSGSFDPTGGRIMGALAAQALIFGIDFTSPEGDDMLAEGSVAQVSYELGFDLIDDEFDMMGYMSGAKSAYLRASAGASSQTMAIASPDMNAAYSANSLGSEMAFAMDGGTMTLTMDALTTSYDVTSLELDGMPIPPFAITLGSAQMDIRLPFNTGGAVEQMKVMMALRDLSLPESLMAMVDPEGHVSRDALTLVIDVDGDIKTNVDWNDPMGAMMMMDNPFSAAEVSQINFNQILLAVAGAEIAANGASTIDNSWGMPMPSGAITLSLRGLQGLMTSLGMAGLVDPNEVGMAMGMVMGFARPGDGADHFVADIEFSPEGVTANGIPLPF